jgi:CO/xanthine dehydrogenase Mo-binding subunit
VTELPANIAAHPGIDAWLAVNVDGSITVRTGKVEIGQGIKTAIAAIAAEELDVDITRIRVETAHTGRTPNEYITAGSRSIEDSGAAVRYMAAAARAHLTARAGAELGVPAAELQVADGVISGPGANRTLTYWTLQGGRPFDLTLDHLPATKSPHLYRIVGKAQRRIDLPAKVFGEPAFVHDAADAGLIHARVLRPPSPTATLEDARLEDFSSPGLQHVLVRGSFVAVVAEREEQALTAAARLRGRLRWGTRPIVPGPGELHDWLDSSVTQRLLVRDGRPVDDPVPPPLRGAGVVTARYTRPYQMHGSLGPSAAVARFSGGRLMVRTHSQGPEILRAALAEVVRLQVADIEVIHEEGAGCYGHNGADDAALDAALVAMSLPGSTISLKWTRSDEHVWEPYAPPMRITLRARLDGAQVVAWDQEIVSLPHSGRPLPVPGHSNLLAAAHLEDPLPRVTARPARGVHVGIHRNGDPLYRFVEKRIVKCFVPSGPLRASSTRGLGAFANVFAIESFMDELALHCGQDPIEFRLAHLHDERAKNVLRSLRDWLPVRPAGQFRGRGVGFAQYKNAQTHCAIAVDLRIEEAPVAIHMERVWIVADAGLVIDRDGLVNQLEGGFIQGASWTLKEAVAYDATGVQSVDWQSYPILRFSEIPEIETRLIDQWDQPARGAGEASVGPAAAAIANAVADACGARLRDLPLTADRLVAELS